MATLKFCRCCGVMLQPDHGIECTNCGADITDPIEGQFSEEDAAILLDAGISVELDEKDETC